MLLTLILMTPGCALQKLIPDAIEPVTWEENRKNLEQIRSWDLSGRIAVQREKESGSASLKWKQREADYVITLIGPLGRGTLELEGNPNGVILRDANRHQQKARDPQTLLLDYLGWQVPVNGLKYWILGLPDPLEDIQTLVLDEKARISELSQAGWHVKFRRYQQAGELHLPAKLEMQNQQLKVKLLIRKWELSP